MKYLLCLFSSWRWFWEQAESWFDTDDIRQVSSNNNSNIYYYSSKTNHWYTAMIIKIINFHMECNGDGIIVTEEALYKR